MSNNSHAAVRRINGCGVSFSYPWGSIRIQLGYTWPNVTVSVIKCISMRVRQKIPYSIGRTILGDRYIIPIRVGMNFR